MACPWLILVTWCLIKDLPVSELRRLVSTRHSKYNLYSVGLRVLFHQNGVNCWTIPSFSWKIFLISSLYCYKPNWVPCLTVLAVEIRSWVYKCNTHVLEVVTTKYLSLKSTPYTKGMVLDAGLWLGPTTQDFVRYRVEVRPSPTTIRTHVPSPPVRRSLKKKRKDKKW